MRVFHGSDVLISQIDLSKGLDFKDFGRGFYVTNIRKHAHKRAIDISTARGTKPVVTEFEYIESYVRTVNLSIKRFEGISQEWVEFVMMNRNRHIDHPAHAYDIVEGPIANDWITRQIERFAKGKISINELIHKVTFGEQTHQICFCTLESLYALELIDDSDNRFAIEDACNNIIEALITDSRVEETTAYQMLYTSSVYEQLTTTDLYNQTWENIYVMLKEELKKQSK
jgi:hypothetical protein